MDAITRQGLITGFACLFATLIAIAANLDQPYWAAITAYMVANVDPSALATKAVLRVAGTVVGCVLGYAVGIMIEGFPVLQALVMFVTAAVGTYWRFRSRYSYAWILGAVSILMLIATSITEPTELHDFAWYRFYEILTGVVVATLFSFAFTLPAHLRLEPAAVTVSHEVARHQALSAGVSIVLIAWLWSVFNLPSLLQVMITSLVVVSADIAGTRLRGLQRIMGCILGGCLGLLVIIIDAANFWWWAFALTAGVFLAGRLHLSPHPHAYVGTQAGLAFLVTLINGSGPPDSIEAPINRLTGIVIGVAIMTIVSWVMAPRVQPAAA
jgi:uncharacterized membrane protein YccC